APRRAPLKGTEPAAHQHGRPATAALPRPYDRHPMGVVERIMAHADRLTATERKIAEVLASEPQTIAFGTVAQVAQRAGTSGPSVVRLAVKLGYDGFVGLQADVQAELARQLGPARDR